jgi:hypothetical protein
LTERADGFKERNKAMTNAFLAKKWVQLTVGYDMEEKSEDVKAMLTLLSGLNVKRGGGFSGRKLYAYFDDVDSANVAASAVGCITCCETKVHKGTFDVKKLVRDNNRITLKEAQVFKTRLAKDATSIINLLNRSRFKQRCKDVKNMMPSKSKISLRK